MIRINGKDISALMVGRQAIAYVYKGARLVWAAISSCFGGVWVSDETWKNDETWLNN